MLKGKYLMTVEVPDAKRRAERESLPQVLVTTFELLRVAAGNPGIVATADGGEVLLRLMTAEELVEQVRAADGPPISLRQAGELTRPLAFPERKRWFL